MTDETRKLLAYWLLVAAKVLSYFAAAILGTVIGVGCKQAGLLSSNL